MTQTLTANQLRAAETKVIAALAEARKARHHRDCHCRMFDRQYCNAADALWQRALERELDRIAAHYRREQDTTT